MPVKKSTMVLSAAAAGVAYLLTRSNALRVYEYDIFSPKLPDEFDGLRIVQLSDLHSKSYGENDHELIEACSRLEPDIIVFTGDLFSRDHSMSYILGRLPLMRGLRQLAPVYYVWGNHESDAPNKAELMNAYLSDIGITVLRNELTTLYRGGSYIDIYGLELSPYFYRSEEGSYRSLPEVTVEDLTKWLGSPREDVFSVLLAHSPLPFKSYADWGADLTFSGHIHGGLIRVFGVGLLSPERRMIPCFTKGLYCEGDSYMILSAGLGKLRINNPEMIAVGVLRKSK